MSDLLWEVLQQNRSKYYDELSCLVSASTFTYLVAFFQIIEEEVRICYIEDQLLHFLTEMKQMIGFFDVPETFYVVVQEVYNLCNHTESKHNNGFEMFTLYDLSVE